MSYMFDDDKAITSSLIELNKHKAHLLKGSQFGSAHALTWSGSQIGINQLGLVAKKGESGDDGEDIEGIIAPVGRLTLPLAITALVSVIGISLPHGWNTGVLNAPSRLIQDFLNETYTKRFGVEPSDAALNLLWSSSVAVYLIGGCAGAFCAGWIADKIGRKRGILVSFIFVFIASALFGFCKMAESFEMLILARIVVGFGGGAGSGLVPMYLTEIAPINIRGAMGVLHQFGLTMGIMLSNLFGLRQILGNEWGWPILLAMTGAPCILACIVLPFFPESPRYLLNTKGDEKAAEAALKVFRGTDDVEMDMDEMRMEKEAEAEEESWTFMQLFRAKDLRMPMILLFSLASCQQLSGVNAVFYYSNGVFAACGIPEDMTQYAVLFIGVINLLMTAISVPLMEKSGRRILLLGGMALMVIADVGLTIALSTQDFLPWMAYISVACTVLFVIGFAIGLGSIPQFIGAEMFKQGPRPPAMSMAGFLNWLCNFLIGISYPSMAAALESYSFLVFIVIIVGFGIFFWWKLPETKNKSVDDIHKSFQKTSTSSSNKYENGNSKKQSVGDKLATEEKSLLENNGVSFNLKPTGKSSTSFNPSLQDPPMTRTKREYKPSPLAQEPSTTFSLQSTGKSSAGSM